MIALLRGRIADRGLDHVVVDVHGVGWLVHMPASHVVDLPDGVDVTLHVSTLVREDAITLYGFRHPDDRAAFEVLRAVNGIGPKLALALLSSLDRAALARAVATDDAATLSRVPGVGRKIASRLCLELKGKLPVSFVVPSTEPRATAPEDPLPLALARLDYKKSEIDAALGHPDVPRYGEAEVADRLRAALRVLARPM